MAALRRAHAGYMTATALAYRCTLAGIAAGREIRDTVQRMALRERAKPCASILKPRGNAQVDAAAEAVGIQHLERLSGALRYPIKLLPEANRPPHAIGTSKGTAAIWVSFDAVDGTVKVAGLGNDTRRRKMRAANDGAWAPVMAFTAPTDKQPQDLRMGDFIAAAMVDGNPTRYKTYPQEIIAVPGRDGRLRTYELAGTRKRRLFTSSNREPAQSFVYLDAFQAYDRETRLAGDEELAVETYRRLINRNDGGAYDVLRHFGSLSAFQRLMLGWHDGPVWYEPQGAAFIVINENLPNLIPAVAIAEGAGALCVDFDGHPLRARRLGAGRTNVVYAANRDILRVVMRLIQLARDVIPTTPRCSRLPV
jgi:hypothetical protein